MIIIAQTFFKETIKKKLLHLLIGLTFIYLILFYTVAYYALKDIKENISNETLIIQSSSSIISIFGFYFSTMLLSFVTIMLSANIISGEIENSVINSIITRPLKRSSYILGKFLGLGIVLICYSLTLYFSIIVIIKILDIPYFGEFQFKNLMYGSFYYILLPISLLSLSVLISTKLKTITSGIILFSIYILGMIGSILEQVGTIFKKEILIQIGIFTSLISPFETIYKLVINTTFDKTKITNSIFGGGFLPSIQPSIWMVLFIIIYIIIMPVFGILSFNKKDL